MRKLSFLFILTCLSFTENNIRPVHIFMIGDSTMANKPENAIPEYGWGQVFHYFFNDSVIIENHAKNGRSSKSFFDEGLWNDVISQVQEGDYVIIQFGHNDKKNDSTRYTSPFGSYKTYLTKYINETKSKGAIPILCTSIASRHFNENGTLIDTHGDYLIAMKQLAEECNVYLIDLESETKKIVEELGPEKSKQLYLFFESGIYPLRPVGLNDSTHLSQSGAFTVASLAIKCMKEQQITVTKYLVNK